MGEPTFEDPIGAEAKTVVLLGRTGIGKSATGNSIIGANVFDTIPNSTTTCQMQRAVVDDGKILDVIDTPGFIGSCFEPEIIAKCINMAKDGIHAFLVVVSVKTCFSPREASSIESLKQVFGSNTSDYMIVVFTHGDAFPRMPLDDFLALSCPESLAKTLKMCGNRHVLFDNVTEDEVKKSQQRKELLRLVDTVVDNNGGIPFTNELFALSPEASEYGDKFYEEAYEEQLKLFIEKSEARLQDRTMGLEKQLAEEQVARILAEAKAQEVQTKSNFEINMLRKDLDRARSEAEELLETLRETEAMLKETKEKFKETEEIFKETEQNFAETKDKFKETEEIFKDMEQNFAEKFKETEKKFKVTEEKNENYAEEYKCTIM